jgi:conjugal transfer pilus assembly protein TraK
MFLKTELAENPVAISLDRHILQAGDTSRLYVVEQRADKSGLRKLAGDLPVMEGVKPGASSKKVVNEKERSSEANQEADDEK